MGVQDPCGVLAYPETWEVICFLVIKNAISQSNACVAAGLLGSA